MAHGAAYDIPLELLTYIFTIARRDVTERGSWTQPSSDAYELGLALCGVCRHFRRTVRGMPEFWDMISVRGRGHDRAFRRLLTCMAVVPEALLDIRFHISLSSYTDDDEEDNEDRTVHDDEPYDHRARFFNPIAAQVHRVCRLQFCFKFEAEWQAMTGCFQYAYAPFLEYLAINARFRVGSNNDDDLDKEIPPASLFKGGAPGPLLPGVDACGPDGQIWARMSLKIGQIGSDAGPSLWESPGQNQRAGRMSLAGRQKF
jgi:hypothetical protein